MHKPKIQGLLLATGYVGLVAKGPLPASRLVMVRAEDRPATVPPRLLTYRSNGKTCVGTCLATPGAVC